MTSTTFRLILLVSCAHALVHVLELALPSVEQMIGEDFGVGTEATGILGTVWRVPFGLGAVFTGWLVDKYGSKRLLMIYLAGGVLTAAMAGFAETYPVVLVSMLLMGCFASIYHPAGLALISHRTTPETRGAALGWHGIFGSIGIASAPFMAGMLFTSGDVSWQQYYLLLTLPALLLFVVFWLWLPGDRSIDADVKPSREDASADLPDIAVARWREYFTLVTAGMLSGFIYAGFMHFLPRYLDGAGLTMEGVSDEGMRNRLAALVLVCGVAGQSLGGKLAKPGRLEIGLTLILLANAPLLLAVGFATGPWRVLAMCLLALIHFMNQPFYNSLIADYVPTSRRSLGYGFSNMAGFSIGGIGPTFAGFTDSDRWTYGGLAIVAILASLVTFQLVRRRPTVNP